MSTVIKYNNKTPMLLSTFPGSIELKRILNERFIGIISALLYVPAYKLEISGGKLKIYASSGGNSNAEGNSNVPELLTRYEEKELAALPNGMSICLNDRYQVIAIRHTGDMNYDNYFAHSRLVPFPCAPVERVKDNKPKKLLEYLVALPSAVWNSGRIGVLPASGKMIHLTGPSIAPMVFLSLTDEYKQMLKKVPSEGFEALLYLAIRKDLPHLAEMLIGKDRFGPESYTHHITTWL